MRVSFARFISLILNPLVITIFAPLILVYRTTDSMSLALYWTVYTLIFLAFLSIFVLVGVKKKIFTDIDISRREQRPLMFFVSLLIGVVYLSTLFVLRGPFALYILTIGILLGVCFVSVINRKVKASIHVAAITALVVPVAISYRGAYSFLLLLIPLVAWSRLITKRHSMPEVLVGGTVGSFLSLSIYLAVKFFLNK